MKTDYKKTVLNIIRCSGGLDNIVAIRRHGTKISITVADMSVVTRRGLEKDPAINGITSWPEETLDIRIKESCIDGVYAELIKHREVTKTFTFAPSEEKGGGGLETQSAQPHCEPAPETGGAGTYTAGYFEDLAAAAIMQAPNLTYEERTAVIDVIKKFAPDAARFANEKHFSTKFAFVPDFIDTVLNASSPTGCLDFTGIAFDGESEDAHITVSRQVKDGSEAYNLLVTAREEGSSISYAGKINEEKVGERKAAEDRATVSGDHRETDRNHPAPRVIDWVRFIFIVITIVSAVNLISFVLLRVPFGTQEKVSPSVSYQEKAEPAQAAEENPTQQAQPAEKDMSKKIDTLLKIGKIVGEINGSIFLLAGVLMYVTSGPYHEGSGMKNTIRLMSTAALCWMIVLICNLLEGASPVLFSTL